jgi:hypothetical protein
MHQHRPAVLIFSALVLGAAPLQAAPAQGPEAVTQAFYAAYLAAHPDGVPEAPVRAKLRPYLTASLAAALASAAKAEALYAKRTHKEVPPLVEGDLFSSLFEGATGMAGVNCQTTGETARCTVSLRYDDAERKSTTKWTDDALLIHGAAGWRIDDIAFGGGWNFARKGRLRETLTYVEQEARAPLD